MQHYKRVLPLPPGNGSYWVEYELWLTQQGALQPCPAWRVSVSLYPLQEYMVSCSHSRMDT